MSEDPKIYNCICINKYTAIKYASANYTAEVGVSFNFSVRGALSIAYMSNSSIRGLTEYTVVSEDGRNAFSLTRDEFLKHFSIKRHIRDKKLKLIGI